MDGKVNNKTFLLICLLVGFKTLPGFTQADPSAFTVTLKIDSAKPGDTLYFSYSKLNNGQPETVSDTLIYQADNVVLRGTVSEPSEATFFRYVVEKVDTADEMKFLEGMKLPEAEKEEMISLFLNPRKPDQYTFFLVPGETSIKAGKKLSSAKAEGPEALSTYIKLKEQFEKLKLQMSYEFYLRYSDAQDLDEKTINETGKAYGKVQKITRDSVYLKFAVENPSSPVSLYALKSALPNQVDSADKYLSVFHTLSPDIKQWHSAKQLLAMLEASKRTEPGQLVEDFQQLDSTGKKVPLSSFRGKYVLIELWASWCIPCRKKNPGLITVQQKYSGKNFTILGIALEEKNDRQKWLNAIKKDKLTWPQLTDFKGWENAVARQFGVRAIPFNLLVDPGGKILAKNIYDAELDLLLGRVLK